jgi:hypothetical protein
MAFERIVELRVRFREGWERMAVDIMRLRKE